MLQARRHRLVRTATPRPINPNFFFHTFIADVKSLIDRSKHMKEQDEAGEYVKQTMETARGIWGEEADKMRQQIETTAAASWRVWRTELSPMIEPATRLRHREKP